MTQSEYEAKKRECWEEYCRTHKTLINGDDTYLIEYEAFDYAFDRAYALGKQSEAISQEEIEKAATNYVKTNPFVNCQNATASRESSKDGANFALGKQEKDAEKKSALTDKEVYALESAISELESLMDGTLDQDYHKEQKNIISALKHIIKKYQKK